MRTQAKVSTALLDISGQPMKHVKFSAALYRKLSVLTYLSHLDRNPYRFA
jgi:hypothetical protein